MIPKLFKPLAEGVFYIPAREEPLSAEVFAIKTEPGWIVCDVGSTPDRAEAVNGLDGKKTVILSHFHADHAGNIKKINCRKILAGAYTVKKIGMGEAVAGRLEIPGGSVFPLPSSHEKGCVALEARGIVFLGDGTYPGSFHGLHGYSAGTLADTLRVLGSTEAEWAALSHRMPKIVRKEAVIRQLEGIYAERKSGENVIVV